MSLNSGFFFDEGNLISYMLMDIADVAQASLKMCFNLFKNPNLSTVSTASYLTPDCLLFSTC
jgi:hypothetical protein